MSFMEQLGKLEKIVSRSSVQAAPQPEVSAHLNRLEQSKAEVMQRISGLCAELGRAYYESHADDHQTEYEAQLAAIREAYAAIAQYEKQAEEIAAGRRCPSCGAQLAEGSLFCNICGTKLQDFSDGEKKEEQNLCPRCHAAISPGDIFCTSCGADLRDHTAENAM